MISDEGKRLEQGLRKTRSSPTAIGRPRVEAESSGKSGRSLTHRSNPLTLTRMLLRVHV